MPRNEQWKSDYLKEMKYFMKEYIMLSSLFPQFKDHEDIPNWRPKLVFIREDLFIFEDVSHLGFRMPNHCETMTYDELKASIQALARFHAASYIFEENKSKELGRPYRIWEDYSEYLQMPEKEQKWRDTGRDAIVEFMRVFSKYKNDPNILKKAETVIPSLFDKASDLTKPSNEYRNVVVHGDLWTNNILIKKDSESDHAVIVDFQTIIYASPMLDLTSVIYFNTTKNDRDKFKDDLINLYHKGLATVLQSSGVNIEDVIEKKEMMKSFHESIAFGLTEASLMVPLISRSAEKKSELLSDPEKSFKANFVSRSEIFIEIAKENETYRNRVIELFDEIVDRYVIDEEQTSIM